MKCGMGFGWSILVWGWIACTTVVLPVFGTSLTADLEGLGLAHGTYWDGADLSGGFRSGLTHFQNAYNTNWFSWSGFAYSSVDNTNTAGYGNQYAVWTPGVGVGGTGAYAVVYDSAWDEQDITTLPFATCVKGFYVNNTAYAALAMRDGESPAKKFGGASGDDEDWFMLTITGKDADGDVVGSVNFYLADYRFADNAQDYIVGEWTWVDLTSLGSAVKMLHYSLSSSDNGAWGMNTPAYFAMDDLCIVPSPTILTADTEDVGVAPGEYWNGADLSGGFWSESAHFQNAYDTTYSSWSGFACSSVNDTNTPGYGNQYAAWTPGVGVGGTGSYAVAYDSAWNNQDIVNFPFRAEVKGLYVNNTTYAALAMRDGESPAKKFGGASGDDEDWFRLTITGEDESGDVVGTVEFYLADYRFANNTEDYIVGEWTWVDLTSFGPAVKSLHFSLSSSDNGAWGMNTPAYYAIDDLQFIYTFSESGADSDLYDAAVPGFVGPGGDGNPDGVSNYVNRAFAGWAASVVDYSPTPDVAAEWTNTLWTLGPVTGTNTHIAALGDLTQEQIDGGMSPGSITLEMEVAISDEAGPDFAVFENALLMGDLTFADLGYVEVSSDGTNFTRFSTACLSTNPVGAYDGLDERYYHGFCGKHLNAYGSSWGTPFDLGELACHPDVQNGTLNLTNVNYVRIVDVPGNGSYFDSAVPANAVYDPWHTFGSGGVDLEAVGVINSPLYARVETTAIGPGQIAPYGMPDGLVAVPLGSNVTFSIAASSGYHLVDVLVNGESQGPIASHTFTGVSSDQSLTAIFGSELLIESLYGESAPLAGTRYGYGPFSVSLVDSPVTMGTTQYVCLGWIGSGSVPTNGVGVEATFSLTNDSTLTWVWGTNYWLDSESDGAGSVDPADGWFAAGQSVTSTATADPYYEFGGWSGDVKGDTNSASIAIAIDGPSSLVAHFWAESATNGVPLAWLDAYGLTNGMPDDIAMSDRFGKGMLLWEEFYAGTDPNDPNSIFAIVDTGMSGVSNYVSWTGGTNGSVLPFAVLGCPDLTSTWTVLDGNVERSPTGTNVWWGTPTESNLFYRIDVNTGQ